MSDIITVFFKDVLKEEEVFDFIKANWGYVMKMEPPSKSQGVIEKGEATIWVYFINDKSFLRCETDNLKDKFDFEISTILQLELNSEDDTRELALDFCKKLLGAYSNSLLLDDTFTKYYDIGELQRTECTSLGIWVEK